MPINNRDNIFGSWPRNKNNNNNSDSEGTINNNLSLAISSLSNSQRTSPISSKSNSPISYPSSPISTSPTNTSPMLSTLRRNYSSTFMLIPEDREIDIIQPRNINENNENISLNNHKRNNFRLQIYTIIIRILLWWPTTMLKIFILLLSIIFKIVFLPFSFAAPSFWFTAMLWVFWKIIDYPLSIIRWIINSFYEKPIDEYKRRTVLISCGSTIQTLHLARNFYSSGARVIIFEFEGLFGLSRFSTAVSKFYTVPRPTQECPQDYIAALCDIVEREKVTYYIPVCATSPAYYDSLAKPHLEILGCSTIIPGLHEIVILDDTLEMMKKCRLNGISLPPFRVLSSKEDLFRLYEIGWLTGYRNLMIAVGTQGLLERHKYILPQNRRDLKLTHEISDEKQWLVVRNVPGNHYITCTTIKESRVIANVTCLVNQNTKNLIPEDNKEIESWLNEFFAKIKLQRSFNGHISFRFVKCESTGHLLPIGSRVGVSLPYICHTGAHSRVLCKPCPHFSRQNSGPLVQEGGRYWISEAVINTIKRPSVDAVGRLIGTVLDKREALFAFWDPLPYCAYYHFQLPLNSVKSFLQKRASARTMATAVAAPVH